MRAAMSLSDASAESMPPLGVPAGMIGGSTLVTSRRFDPERTLALVEEHRAEVLAAVPVMLARMLALPPEQRHDLSSLRVVALSGSALPVELGRRWIET